MGFRDSAVELLLRIRDQFSPAAKNVEKAARSLRDVAEDLADQVKKTDQAMAQATALETLRERSKRLGEASKEAGTRIKELRDAVKYAGDAAAKEGFAEQLKETERSAKALRQEAKSVAREIFGLEKALAAAGVDTSKLATEQRRLARASADATDKLQQIKKAVPALKDVGEASHRARTGVVQLNDGINRLTGNILGLVGAYGALNAAQGTLARVDQFLEYESRLKNATKSEEEYQAARKAVLDINQRTGASFDSLTALYQRSADSMQALGKSHEESTALIEGVAKVTRISGASAQSASAALIQFAQGLGAGRLAGDEFKSIAENMPTLLDHIAEGLKISRGELRKWSEEGRLTGEVVLNALQGQLAAIDAQFANAPKTIGVAAQKLSDAWSNYLRTSEDVAATQATIASALDLVRTNLDGFVKSAIFAGEVVAAALGFKLLLSLISIRRELAVIRAESGVTFAQMVLGANASTAATAGTTRALAVMAGTLRALSALGFGVVFAAAYELGTYIADKLDPALSNLRSAFAQLELQNAKGERRLAQFNRELGTNYKTMEDANRAIDDGLIVWDAQLGKWEKAENAAKRQENAFKVAAKSYEDFAAKIAKLNKDFDDLVKTGTSVESAIENIAKSALKTEQPARLLSLTLAGLQDAGKATADQIGKALPAAFEQLSNARAAQVVHEAQAALNKGTVNAEAYAQVIRAALSPAFARLGVDAGIAMGGLSDKATQAIRDFETLTETAQLTSAGFKSVFDATVKAADSVAAVEALSASLVRLKDAGKLTNDELASGQAAIKERTAELTPGIQSVGEAYKQLGITAQAELKKIAEESRKAYEFLKSEKAPLEDQKAAWLKYAEAAIKANGGVASETLRAQAAVMGMSAELANLEKSVNPVSAAMQALAARYDDMAKAAERETNAIQDQVNLKQQAAQTALDLAKAEGDALEIRRAELQVAEAALESLVLLAEAKQNEADVTWAKVRALKEEAAADLQVTEAEKELIAAAREAALVKQEAADQALAHAAAEKKRADALRDANAEMRTFQIGADDLAEQMGIGAEYADRFGKRLGELAARSAYASREMGFLRQEAKAYADELAEVDKVVAAAAAGQIDLAELANYNISRFYRLGQEDLAPLRDAIDDARQRMADLADEAADTLASVSEELAELEGREADAEKIRQERKVKELEAKLAEARAAGNASAAADYEKAIRLLEEVNKIRAEQAKAKDSGKSAPFDGARSSRTTPGVSPQRGDAFGPVRTVRIEVGGEGFDVPEAQEQTAVGLLQRLANLKRVSTRG